jgi:hypothetical protein
MKMKSKWMKWAGYVARMYANGKEYNLVVRNLLPSKKIPLGRPRHR